LPSFTLRFPAPTRTIQVSRTEPSSQVVTQTAPSGPGSTLNRADWVLISVIGLTWVLLGFFFYLFLRRR
jgi:hypothetical protein